MDWKEGNRDRSCWSRKCLLCSRRCRSRRCQWGWILFSHLGQCWSPRLDSFALKLCLSCNQLTSSQWHWHRIFQTYKARVADGLGFTCSEIARFDFYWSIGRCCNRTSWLLTHVHIYNVDSTFIQCCSNCCCAPYWYQIACRITRMCLVNAK